MVLCQRDAGDALTMVAGVLFACAGCIDIIANMQRILQAAWAPAVGKLLAVTLCVALAAVSLSLAKGYAHTLIHIDPKHLAEFNAILGVCLLPVVYGIALTACVGIYGLLQLVILCVFMMVTAPMYAYIGERYRDRMRLARFRILHGKRPLSNRLPGRKIFAVDDWPHIAKPIGTLAVAFVLSSLLQSVIAVLPTAEPTLTTMLVGLEYRKASACTNISKDLPVAYMDNGLVSVALPHGSIFQFEVRQCDFFEPQPPAGSG